MLPDPDTALRRRQVGNGECVRSSVRYIGGERRCVFRAAVGGQFNRDVPIEVARICPVYGCLGASRKSPAAWRNINYRIGRQVSIRITIPAYISHLLFREIQIES